MKSVLVCLLTYGQRPLNTLFQNVLTAGYPAEYIQVNREGIAKAQNEGLRQMRARAADIIAFCSNDITEPPGWLRRKVEALGTYPEAGIVASSLEQVYGELRHGMIISNWALSRAAVEKIGAFNETFHPYGPIDLDYCERAWAAGFKTYYVMNCMATHAGGHATGTEYGYSKEQLVRQYWAQYEANVREYHAGTRPFHLPLPEPPEAEAETQPEPFYWTQAD